MSKLPSRVSFVTNWFKARLAHQNPKIDQRFLRHFDAKELRDAAKSIELAAAELIDKQYRHFKMSSESKYSLSTFIRSFVRQGSDVNILDLGAHDGYLYSQLIEHLGDNSSIKCIDNHDHGRAVDDDRVTFVYSDILSFLKKTTESYDFVIISGVLSLFDLDDRIAIMEYISRLSKYVIIREVPKVRTVLDAYLVEQGLYQGVWKNFSYSELIDFLVSCRMNVKSVSHDYDIYILAKCNDEAGDLTAKLVEI